MSNTEFGTFIPYRIGEMFYDICRSVRDHKYSIMEYKVSRLHVKADNTLKIRLTKLGSSGVVFEVTEKELCNDYFDNLDYAKAALKRMEGHKDE